MASYERRGKYWSVRFRYIDERGLEVNKRLSKDESENNFATKKEAEQAYIQFISAIKQNKKLATQKITKFIDLFNEYIEYRKTRVKESTYFNVLYIYKEHILPYFSNYKLSDITAQVINKWQQGLEKYSYKYKTKIRNYCKLVLDYGEKYYHIPNNFKFCDNFTKSNESSKEMHIWTPAQFEVFDNQITDLQDKTMFNFLYLMGTRKGEMGALRWSDVDFGNKTCTISKSLTRGEGGLKLGATTKNQKRRVVVIPTKLLKLLVELKKHQSRDEVFSEEWFVFGSKNNHLTYT